MCACVCAEYLNRCKIRTSLSSSIHPSLCVNGCSKNGKLFSSFFLSCLQTRWLHIWPCCYTTSGKESTKKAKWERQRLTSQTVMGKKERKETRLDGMKLVQTDIRWSYWPHQVQRKSTIIFLSWQNESDTRFGSETIQRCIVSFRLIVDFGKGEIKSTPNAGLRFEQKSSLLKWIGFNFVDLNLIGGIQPFKIVFRQRLIVDDNIQSRSEVDLEKREKINLDCWPVSNRSRTLTFRLHCTPCSELKSLDFRPDTCFQHVCLPEDVPVEMEEELLLHPHERWWQWPTRQTTRKRRWTSSLFSEKTKEKSMAKG